MILWIKKGIVAIVSPFALSLLLLLVGFFALIAQKRKTGLLLTGCAILVLLLSGYGVLNGQLEKLDSQFTPLNAAKLSLEQRSHIRHIVVLGSGHVSDPRLPPTSVINGDSLYRLVEGIRLMRQLPGTRLVVSGGKGFDTVANAEVMASVAQLLGMRKNDIVVEPRPQDTAEEARLLKPVLQNTPFVLVTSAVHMNRAMHLFTKQGLHPIPAPTDYIFRKNTRAPMDLLPSLRNASLTQRMVYELLGQLWGIVTGQI